MGQIEINHTGSGGGVVLSSDGTDLLLGGSAIGGGGGASAYTISTKTDNYTAVAGDLGKLIHFTQIGANKTLTLTAAATLGAGWFCYVRYSGIHSGPSYKVIIDPNGSETIDGELTRNMFDGQTFQILCDGSNFHILSSDDSRAFSHNAYYNGVGTYGQPLAQPEASGTYAIALGGAALSSGTGSVALGYDSQSTGSNSLAGPKSTATGQYSVSLGIGSPAGTYSGARGAGSIAIGQGARASTSGSLAIGQYSVSEGSNSSAIGQSLASGSHSFAAGITSNSSSYGATGANSVAIGYLNKATHNKSVSLGDSNSAVGAGAITLGSSNFNSGVYSTTIGYGHQLYGKTYSLAIGRISMPRSSYSFTHGIWGTAGNAGEAQAAQYVMSALTTDATPDELAIGAAGNTDNYIVLANSAAVTFTGTVVAREDASDGDDYAGWELKGVIMRAANAGTTALGVGIVNSLYHTAGLANADVALTADTSNGGLKITVTGVASTNLNWVATINTSEVVNT